MPEPVGGYRVGWIEGPAMLYAEGHPAGEGQLANPSHLPAAFEQLRRQLLDAGVPLPDGRAADRLRAGQLLARGERRYWVSPETGEVLGLSDPNAYERVPGFAGVRRVDATVDLAMDRGSDGIAVLRGVA